MKTSIPNLMPHQKATAAFLSASTGVRGDFSGMGTGKTRSALEAALRVGAESGLVVVAPPIALEMWKEEIERWCGLEVVKAKSGTNPEQGKACAHVISYSLIHILAPKLKDKGFGILICDESHALRNFGSKRTQAIFGADGLATHFNHVWALTGTPIVRWNDDIYPFLRNAASDVLSGKTGSIDEFAFNSRYCLSVSKQFNQRMRPVMVTCGNRNTNELNGILFNSGIAIRHELKDVQAHMPPLTIGNSVVQLKYKDNRSLFHRRSRDIVNEHKSQIVSGNTDNVPGLASLVRELGEAKVSESAHFIHECVSQGRGPILVGAWHKSVINETKRALEDLNLDVSVIDGSTAPKERLLTQERFNAKKTDVLIGQLAAMGTSINLQHGGHYIVVLERSWSPSVMDQFYARLYRTGQERSVHIEILNSNTLIDNLITKVLDNKRTEHKRVLGNEG